MNKTYVRHDLSGFHGDRDFITDEGGQEVFAKLRSSIAGVYAWRLKADCPPQYQPTSEAEKQRLFKEADFAFKQSFALSPGSMETTFRYVELLCQFHRTDDALLIAETSYNYRTSHNSESLFQSDSIKSALKTVIDNLKSAKAKSK